MLLLALLVSHCSPRLAWVKPTPQAGSLHRSVQPSSWSWFRPSSHCSPTSSTELPQASRVHWALQPSPPTRLASSQASAGPRSPSPQTLIWQLLRQAFWGPLLAAPLSQVSVPPPWLKTRPSPQVGSAQLRVQAPPLLLAAPLSHFSKPCLTPSPQRGLVQAVVQASLLLALPSSQASVAWTIASPQVASLQALVQASLLTGLPSSQPSIGPTLPSPQTLIVQFSLQAAVLALFGPVSHCSPGPTSPSPQTLIEQSARQAALGPLAGPSSHCSPTPAWRISSPHTAITQASLQASSSTALPSSQASGAWTTASPQLARVQVLVHSSSSMSSPSSQGSPGPTRPSPQTFCRHAAVHAL